MYHHRKNVHVCSEFIEGVRRFINFVFLIDKNVSESKI
jgi:hypothetical protein